MDVLHRSVASLQGKIASRTSPVDQSKLRYPEINLMWSCEGDSKNIVGKFYIKCIKYTYLVSSHAMAAHHANLFSLLPAHTVQALTCALVPHLANTITSYIEYNQENMWEWILLANIEQRLDHYFKMNFYHTECNLSRSIQEKYTYLEPL